MYCNYYNNRIFYDFPTNAKVTFSIELLIKYTIKDNRVY